MLWPYTLYTTTSADLTRALRTPTTGVPRWPLASLTESGQLKTYLDYLTVQIDTLPTDQETVKLPRERLC